MSYLPLAWKVEWKQTDSVDWINKFSLNLKKVIEYGDKHLKEVKGYKGYILMNITIRMRILVWMEGHVIVFDFGFFLNVCTCFLFDIWCKICGLLIGVWTMNCWFSFLLLSLLSVFAWNAFYNRYLLSSLFLEGPF